MSVKIKCFFLRPEEKKRREKKLKLLPKEDV